MSILRFSVTYDYRCPFARNVHEHIIEALRHGVGWEVDFVPFSLSQIHMEEGGTPVWDDPAKAPSLLAVEAGLVVRDRFPDRFLDVHEALFAARHDRAEDIRQEAVIRTVLQDAGVDTDQVFEAVADGWPRHVFRKAHDQAVSSHQVFGVPTFVVGDVAVFVRVMTRPAGDAELARATIEHVLALMAGHPELNEFKHTTVSR